MKTFIFRIAPIHFVCASFLICLAQAHAEVDVSVRSAARVIHTDAFEAVIDWDGCFTSLKVAGADFLASGVSISRGGYFYQAGVLRLEEIEHSSPNVVTASSERASARYQFDERHVTIELQNRSDESMVYLFVGAAGINLARDDSGKFAPSAIAADTNEITLFRGKNALHISGISKAWGPWERSHQVVEIRLKPGELKEVRLQVRDTSSEERQQIATLITPPKEAPLTVLSPRNYQVIQRRSVRKGEVLISGRCRMDVDAVDVLVTGESPHDTLPEGWRSISTVSELHEFNLRLVLPAGGWYELKLRAKKAGAIVAESSVQHFGVGEVFVGAGQSNSTNCGQFKTQQTSGMVSSFGGTHWQLADDPQPGAADQSQGGSFWPAFGDLMYERYQVPIGVAVTGFGGTSVNQWQPGDELFDWMMKRIYQLGPAGFRALLWHQGESDVEMNSDEYFSKLHNIISASRAQAGWEFPWFVAQASYHNEENPSFDNIRSAQQRLWENGLAPPGS